MFDISHEDKETARGDWEDGRTFEQDKTGQTKFTVYHHKDFGFVCGQVVIFFYFKPVESAMLEPQNHQGPAL